LPPFARGEIWFGAAMLKPFVEPSRTGEYRNQARMLRSLAFQSRYLESKGRLLALADSFDKLAEQVEALEIAVANIA
jgi:hypothetical protein